MSEMDELTRRLNKLAGTHTRHQDGPTAAAFRDAAEMLRALQSQNEALRKALKECVGVLNEIGYGEGSYRAVRNAHAALLTSANKEREDG